jgi:hypothetical protein
MRVRWTVGLCHETQYKTNHTSAKMSFRNRGDFWLVRRCVNGRVFSFRPRNLWIRIEKNNESEIDCRFVS